MARTARCCLLSGGAAGPGSATPRIRPAERDQHGRPRRLWRRQLPPGPVVPRGGRYQQHRRRCARRCSSGRCRRATTKRCSSARSTCRRARASARGAERLYLGLRARRPAAPAPAARPCWPSKASRSTRSTRACFCRGWSAATRPCSTALARRRSAALAARRSSTWHHPTCGSGCAEARAFNALFLHDLDTAALNQGQRAALAGWVGLGGQLVVSGPACGARAGRPGRPAAGAVGPGELSQGGLDRAGRAGRRRPSGPPAERHAQSPAGPAGRRATSARQRPAAAPALRLGAVILRRVRFRQPARPGPARRRASGAACCAGAAAHAGAGAQLSRSSACSTAACSSCRRCDLPSPWTLVLFMLVYVLVIGPLNYVVLRRMRRLELAWITVPLVVLLFTAWPVCCGRGAARRCSTSWLWCRPARARSRGHATSFLSLFSPRRTRPARQLRQPRCGQRPRNRCPTRFEPVVVGEQRALSVLADISSVTTLVAEAAVDLPVRVQSAVISDTGL